MVATPTPGPHAGRTAMSPPPATPIPEAPDITRSPVFGRAAHDAGREDCPKTWLVYEGEGISVCFPSDHDAQTWSRGEPPVFFSVRLIPGEPVAYTPYGVSVWRSDEYLPPTECVFEQEAIDPTAETDLVRYEVAGYQGVGCTARTAYAVQFKGAVRAPSGGLEFDAQAADDEQLELAKEILSTVLLLPSEDGESGGRDQR